MDVLFVLALVVIAWALTGHSGGSAVAADARPYDGGPSPDSVSNYGGGPIDDLLEAWARVEGYYKSGSIPDRQNNPGDVKGDYPGAIGSGARGITVFADAGDGWDAARAWVERNARQHPDWSLNQLFAKILGSMDGSPVDNEQGNSSAMAASVAGYMGVSPDDSVSSVLGGA